MKKLSFVLSSALSLLFLTQNALAIDVEFEQDRSLPMIHVSVLIDTGYAHDPADQQGLTAFTSYMLLRGTKSRSKEQFDRELELLGATLGVESRAEAVLFSGSTLSSELPKYLSLLEDALTQASFPEVELGKLRDQTISVILDERSNDAAAASSKFQRFVMKEHPYGNDEYGTIKNIEKFTREDALKLYDKIIRANKITIMASGDCGPSSDCKPLRDFATRLEHARPGGDLTPVLPVPSPDSKRRLLLVNKPDRTQTQIDIGQQGLLYNDPRHPALIMANYILGGPTFSSRMTKEIRVERGWSYGAYSSFRFGRQPRYFRAHLYPATKDTPAALAYTLGMLQKFASQGITEAEFNFARQSLLNNDAFNYNTSRKRIDLAILERNLKLEPGTIRQTMNKLATVTREDVNRAIESFLKPEALSMSVLCTVTPELKSALAKAALVEEKDVQVVNFDQD